MNLSTDSAWRLPRPSQMTNMTPTTTQNTMVLTRPVAFPVSAPTPTPMPAASASEPMKYISSPPSFCCRLHSLHVLTTSIAHCSTTSAATAASSSPNRQAQPGRKPCRPDPVHPCALSLALSFALALRRDGTTPRDSPAAPTWSDPSLPSRPSHTDLQPKGASRGSIPRPDTRA